MTSFFTGTPEITVEVDTPQALASLHGYVLVNGLNDLHTATVELTESNPQDDEAKIVLDILGDALDKLIEAGFDV